MDGASDQRAPNSPSPPPPSPAVSLPAGRPVVSGVNNLRPDLQACRHNAANIRPSPVPADCRPHAEFYCPSCSRHTLRYRQLWQHSLSIDVDSGRHELQEQLSRVFQHKPQRTKRTTPCPSQSESDCFAITLTTVHKFLSDLACSYNNEC